MQQPEALRATAAYYATDAGRVSLEAAATALKNHDRIVAIGMGSSYFLAGAFSLSLAAKGIMVDVVNAGELLHYGLKAITDDTLVVAISQSGESYETVNALTRLEEAGVRPEVIAITNESRSTLARRAGITLPTLAGPEEKTSSKTFITAYQVITLITDAIEGKRPEESVWTGLADEVQKILDSRDSIVPVMLAALGDAGYLQLVARGTTMAAASQSALMAMEASHTPASALSGGEFRHGPLEMVQPGFTAIVLAHSASKTFGRTEKLIGDILRFGGNVMLVSDRKDAVAPAERLTVIEAPCKYEQLFAISSIVPVQLAVETWAREVKGITPGEFTHGAKVTSIE